MKSSLFNLKQFYYLQTILNLCCKLYDCLEAVLLSLIFIICLFSDLKPSLFNLKQFYYVQNVSNWCWRLYYCLQAALLSSDCLNCCSESFYWLEAFFTSLEAVLLFLNCLKRPFFRYGPDNFTKFSKLTMLYRTELTKRVSSKFLKSVKGF